MIWLIAHRNINEGFPEYLSVEDKIVVNRIKAERLIKKIQEKYPTIKVLQFSTLGSQIEIPFEINVSEFEKEFDCVLC